MAKKKSSMGKQLGGVAIGVGVLLAASLAWSAYQWFAPHYRFKEGQSVTCDDADVLYGNSAGTIYTIANRKWYADMGSGSYTLTGYPDKWWSQSQLMEVV